MILDPLCRKYTFEKQWGLISFFTLPFLAFIFTDNPPQARTKLSSGDEGTEVTVPDSKDLRVYSEMKIFNSQNKS